MAPSGYNCVHCGGQGRWNDTQRTNPNACAGRKYFLEKAGLALSDLKLSKEFVEFVKEFKDDSLSKDPFFWFFNIGWIMDRDPTFARFVEQLKPVYKGFIDPPVECSFCTGIMCEGSQMCYETMCVSGRPFSCDCREGCWDDLQDNNDTDDPTDPTDPENSEYRCSYCTINGGKCFLIEDSYYTWETGVLTADYGREINWIDPGVVIWCKSCVGPYVDKVVNTLTEIPVPACMQNMIRQYALRDLESIK